MRLPLPLLLLLPFLHRLHHHQSLTPRLLLLLSMPQPPALPRSSGTSLALESTLVAEERRDFPLVWRGDWLPYGEMYLAELSRRFMGGPKKRAATAAGKGTK